MLGLLEFVSFWERGGGCMDFGKGRGLLLCFFGFWNWNWNWIFVGFVEGVGGGEMGNWGGVWLDCFFWKWGGGFANSR